MTQRQTQVKITPEMAKGFLAKSKGNRTIRAKTKLLAYKKDMERGAWQYNGDAIRFTYEGALVDGHHRLTACVETGCAFEADIVYIPASSVQTMDKGAARSDGDNLVMDFGYEKKKAGMIASSVRQILCHDSGNHKWPTPGGALSHMFTYHVIHSWMEDNKHSMIPVVDFVGGLDRAHILVGASHICSALYLGSRVHGFDIAQEYMIRILTGYGVDPQTTEDHIRTALIQSRMAQRKMQPWVAAMTICKGMRAFARGHNYTLRSNAVYRPGIDNPVFYK
jgi:hypothetical protein